MLKVWSAGAGGQIGPIKSYDLSVQQQIMATPLSGDYVSH